MAGEICAALEHDDIFAKLQDSIEDAIQLVDRLYKARAKAWLVKISQLTNNVLWKKNRNNHARLLLEQLRTGVLEAPYDCMPPQGPLPTLNPCHMYRYLSPSRRGGSPGAPSPRVRSALPSSRALEAGKGRGGAGGAVPGALLGSASLTLDRIRGLDAARGGTPPSPRARRGGAPTAPCGVRELREELAAATGRAHALELRVKEAEARQGRQDCAAGSAQRQAQVATTAAAAVARAQPRGGGGGKGGGVPPAQVGAQAQAWVEGDASAHPRSASKLAAKQHIDAVIARFEARRSQWEREDAMERAADADAAAAGTTVLGLGPPSLHSGGGSDVGAVWEPPRAPRDTSSCGGGRGVGSNAEDWGVSLDPPGLQRQADEQSHNTLRLQPLPAPAHKPGVRHRRSSGCDRAVTTSSASDINSRIRLKLAALEASMPRAGSGGRAQPQRGRGRSSSASRAGASIRSTAPGSVAGGRDTAPGQMWLLSALMGSPTRQSPGRERGGGAAADTGAWCEAAAPNLVRALASPRSSPQAPQGSTLFALAQARQATRSPSPHPLIASVRPSSSSRVRAGPVSPLSQPAFTPAGTGTGATRARRRSATPPPPASSGGGVSFTKSGLTALAKQSLEDKQAAQVHPAPPSPLSPYPHRATPPAWGAGVGGSAGSTVGSPSFAFPSPVSRLSPSSPPCTSRRPPTAALNIARVATPPRTPTATTTTTTPAAPQYHTPAFNIQKPQLVPYTPSPMGHSPTSYTVHPTPPNLTPRPFGDLLSPPAPAPAEEAYPPPTAHLAPQPLQLGVAPGGRYPRSPPSRSRSPSPTFGAHTTTTVAAAAARLHQPSPSPSRSSRTHTQPPPPVSSSLLQALQELDSPNGSAGGGGDASGTGSFPPASIPATHRCTSLSRQQQQQQQRPGSEYSQGFTGGHPSRPPSTHQASTRSAAGASMHGGSAGEVEEDGGSDWGWDRGGGASDATESAPSSPRPGKRVTHAMDRETVVSGGSGADEESARQAMARFESTTGKVLSNLQSIVSGASRTPPHTHAHGFSSSGGSSTRSGAGSSAGSGSNGSAAQPALPPHVEPALQAVLSDFKGSVSRLTAQLGGAGAGGGVAAGAGASSSSGGVAEAVEEFQHEVLRACREVQRTVLQPLAAQQHSSAALGSGSLEKEKGGATLPSTASRHSRAHTRALSSSSLAAPAASEDGHHSLCGGEGEGGSAQGSDYSWGSRLPSTQGRTGHAHSHSRRSGGTFAKTSASEAASPVAEQLEALVTSSRAVADAVSASASHHQDAGQVHRRMQSQPATVGARGVDRRSTHTRSSQQSGHGSPLPSTHDLTARASSRPHPSTGRGDRHDSALSTLHASPRQAGPQRRDGRHSGDGSDSHSAWGGDSTLDRHTVAGDEWGDVFTLDGGDARGVVLGAGGREAGVEEGWRGMDRVTFDEGDLHPRGGLGGAGLGGGDQGQPGGTVHGRCTVDTEGGRSGTTLAVWASSEHGGGGGLGSDNPAQSPPPRDAEHAGDMLERWLSGEGGSHGRSGQGSAAPVTQGGAGAVPAHHHHHQQQSIKHGRRGAHTAPDQHQEQHQHQLSPGGAAIAARASASMGTGPPPGLAGAVGAVGAGTGWSSGSDASHGGSGGSDVVFASAKAAVAAAARALGSRAGAAGVGVGAVDPLVVMTPARLHQPLLPPATRSAVSYSSPTPTATTRGGLGGGQAGGVGGGPGAGGRASSSSSGGDESYSFDSDGGGAAAAGGQLAGPGVGVVSEGVARVRAQAEAEEARVRAFKEASRALLDEDPPPPPPPPPLQGGQGGGNEAAMHRSASLPTGTGTPKPAALTAALSALGRAVGPLAPLSQTPAQAAYPSTLTTATAAAPIHWVDGNAEYRGALRALRAGEAANRGAVEAFQAAKRALGLEGEGGSAAAVALALGGMGGL